MQAVDVQYWLLGCKVKKTYSRIDVSVSSSQSPLHSLLNVSGLGLPCSEADGWNLVARVEGEGLSTNEVLACYMSQLEPKGEKSCQKPLRAGWEIGRA